MAPPFLRFAILGGGHGGKVYIPALTKAGQLSVVLAGRTKRPELAIEHTSDWRNAIARKDVDAVVIALPPALQREAVFAAIAAGKPFICEKPAGLNGKDAAAMCEAAERAALAHAVGFQFRYEAGFDEMKRRILRGEVGHIEHIDVDWYVGAENARTRPWSWRNDAAQGGGVVLNFATHVLDYVRWLSGGESSLVSRTERILVSNRVDDNGLAREVTAPDSCDFVLALGGLGIASMRICNVAQRPLGHRVIVRGDKGTLEFLHRPPFRNTDMELSITDAKGGALTLVGPQLGAHAADEDSRVAPTIRLIESFTRRVSGENIDDLPSLRDAVKVHELIGRR